MFQLHSTGQHHSATPILLRLVSVLHRWRPPESCVRWNSCHFNILTSRAFLLNNKRTSATCRDCKLPASPTRIAAVFIFGEGPRAKKCEKFVKYKKTRQESLLLNENENNHNWLKIYAFVRIRREKRKGFFSASARKWKQQFPLRFRTCAGINIQYCDVTLLKTSSQRTFLVLFVLFSAQQTVFNRIKKKWLTCVIKSLLYSSRIMNKTHLKQTNRTKWENEAFITSTRHANKKIYITMNSTHFITSTQTFITISSRE